MTTMGHNSVLGLTPLILVASLASCYEVKLSHLSTAYLPHSFSGDTPQYGFDTGAVERAVFEPTDKVIYAVGHGIIHIIDASNPTNLTYLNHVTLVNKELTDVAVCGTAIFVTYIDLTNLLQGGVLQYQLYSQQSGTLTFKRDIKIGTAPDMLTSTSDCTLVVALENSGVEVNGQFQDPPGGVGIIRFLEGVTNTPDVTTLDFTAFDNRFEALSRTGVRWVYRGSNNKFSDDLEPEYVTLNADQTKAFVGIQENSAIAVVDLVTRNITAIHGLGFKNWTQYKLDPSDKDNGINMARWPLYGIYQPDGLQWFRWSGKDYVVTANEGSAKKYLAGNVDFQEDERGDHFTAALLSASVSSELRNALQDETKLGRLELSTVDGKDQDGKFKQLYTYGGRSFSIWRASDMQQVYDSGSALSEKTKDLRRELFNTDIKDADDKVADRMDKRSDNKGPEPQSVAVAQVQGHLLFFVGIEKPGTIAVYGVAPGQPLLPRFKSLYTDGIPRGNSTWREMYDARQLHAIDLEYIGFIGADSGLANYPLLLVAGTTSGTVSFLKVEMMGVTSGCPTVEGSLLTLLAASLLAVISRVSV